MLQLQVVLQFRAGNEEAALATLHAAPAECWADSKVALTALAIGVTCDSEVLGGVLSKLTRPLEEDVSFAERAHVLLFRHHQLRQQVQCCSCWGFVLEMLHSFCTRGQCTHGRMGCTGRDSRAVSTTHLFCCVDCTAGLDLSHCGEGGGGPWLATTSPCCVRLLPDHAS